MKYKVITGIMLTLLILGMLTLAFNIQTVKPEPTTIIVPDDYPTIQEAINNANDGDTIDVRAGTYYGVGYVTVNKSVSLVGENPNTTIIDGMGMYVEVNDVTITNFTIRDVIGKLNLPGDGILSFGDNTTITKNIISNCRKGMYIFGGSDNLITENVLTNGGTGIEVSYRNYVVTRNNVVSNNVVINNRYIGIVLVGVQNSYLRNNTLSGNFYGMNVYATGAAGKGMVSQYVHDIDTSNTIDGKPVYYWVNQHNKQVPTDAGWVVIVNSTNITIKNLEMTRSTQGLELQFTNSSTIENVKVSNNDAGIRIGLYCYNNTIIQSTIENNNNGIVLHCFSSGNSLSENNITKNTIGVSLSWASNNKLYHNNFIDNTKQVDIDMPDYPNVWDDGYPSGGNYWSDYSGLDVYSGPYQDVTGSDGIGDTGYVIDAENVDHYPLMEPYGAQHDIGITSVTTSKTIIGQGYSLGVNIRIRNYGVDTENFNITAYANTTVIQIKNVTITTGNSTTIAFTWNTTGVPYGNYTISANVTVVPGETYTTDNNYTDGLVVVTKVGDVNGDGKVDSLDVKKTKAAYSGWVVDPNADVNGDDTINSLDVKVVKQIYSGWI